MKKVKYEVCALSVERTKVRQKTGLSFFYTPRCVYRTMCSSLTEKEGSS